MEVDFFCEVAWLKLGRCEPGARRAPPRVPPAEGEGRQGEVPARPLRAATPSACRRPRSTPTASSSRATTAATTRDREAEQTTFRLPEPGPDGARSQVALNGLWEICRDDEQEPGPVAEPIGALPRAPVLARDRRPRRQEHAPPRPRLRPSRLVPHAGRGARVGRRPLLLPGLPAEQPEHDRLRQRRALRLRQEPVRPGPDRHHPGRSSRA